MSIIGGFPGIDGFVETADAVVVATILRHIPSPGIRINDFSEFYECYINQTLKGDLQPRSKAVLRLENFSSEFSNPLGLYTVAILFLSKHGKDKHGSEYSSPHVEGATIVISPDYGTVSQAGTPKARIKALIRQYRQYRAKQIRGEEKFLQQVLQS